MNALTHKTLYGNWATLILANDVGGGLDTARLADEVDALIASAPDGIYSNGTAGEFYAQTEEEFDTVSRILSEKCEKAGVAYQIGVSHMAPLISLDRLKRIKHLRPGAVQVILPDWFPVTMEEAVSFLLRMEAEADAIPLVLYNPPHAKVKLVPGQWMELKQQVHSLIGVKVFDNNRDPKWYETVGREVEGLSVFIPGHHLATGISLGAHGAYSNVACLNPAAAQKWYNMMQTDMEAAMELEGRINTFMSTLIHPFIAEMGYPNHACDRFMALLGGWADVGATMRWPYRSIPVSYIPEIRKKANDIIPEFFQN